MIINRDLALMEIEQLLLRQQSQEFGCFVYSARALHAIVLGDKETSAAAYAALKNEIGNLVNTNLELMELFRQWTGFDRLHRIAKERQFTHTELDRQARTIAEILGR